MQALSDVIHQHSLADVAYTLAARRSRYMHRAFYLVDKDQIAAQGGGGGAGGGCGIISQGEGVPQIFTSPQRSRAAFVFTGQGAQWAGMGAELFEYAAFRRTIARLDGVLAALPTNPVGWRIADVLSGVVHDREFIQNPGVSQTVCTALQIGLVDLLASWAVRPVGVVGHSSGEMAAAYAAGRLTAAEAITAAYYRGHVVSLNTKKGAMLAAGLGSTQGLDYITAAGLAEKVKVAAINSPDSITMSGDADAIEELSAKLTQDSVFNRVLRTGGLAYHSHHMRALGNDYSQLLEHGFEKLGELSSLASAHRYPQVPWVSSVTPDKELERGQVTASYWRANLESPVRFAEAASKLLGSEDLAIGCVIEIGPHAALKNPLGQIGKSLGKTIPHVSTVTRGEDARRTMLNLAGTLFALNADVNMAAVNAVDDESEDGRRLATGCLAVDLPTYKYTYGPINYHESRLSREYRLRKVPRHDLLGSRVPGTTRLRPQWRNLLRLKDLPWLGDHRVPPHVLHPGAAHVVMAMVAAEHAYADYPDALPVAGVTLRNLSIKKTLVVPEDDHGVEIVLSMELEDGATARAPGWSGFSIASVVRDTDQWTEHCSGLVRVEVAPFDLPAPMETAAMDGRAVDAESWYTRFSDMGLHFGPSFQGYSEIRADPARNLASARLALNTTAGLFPGGESSYPIHPASFDLLVRLGLMACNGGQADTLAVQLPIHLDEMRFKHGFLDGRDWVTGVSVAEKRGLRSAYGDLQMLDDKGNVFLHVDNMKFTSLNNDFGDAARSAKLYSSPFARLTWRPDIRAMSKDQCCSLLPITPEERTGQFSQLSKIVDLVAHANPSLRILELGAGRDMGAAQAILKTLTGPNGIKRYQKYVLTDVSMDQLAPVRQATTRYQDIGFSALNIENDLLKQGFQANAYDMILWSDAASSSADIHQCLEHVRKILKPGGDLVLFESSGTSPTDWREALPGAGFEPRAELEDPTNQDCRRIVFSTLLDTAKEQDRSGPVVHLLHGSSGAPALLDDLSQALERRGLATRTVPLDRAREDVPAHARVVAFLDGENLLFHADQRRIGLFQHLAAHAATMVWITSCGLARGRDPDGAFVAGLLRTLGTENPSGQFLSVDLDAEGFRIGGAEEGEQETGELVRCLVEQEAALQGLGESVECEVNRDYTWQDGCLWVSRVVPDAALEDYAEPVLTPEDKDLKLEALHGRPMRAVFGTPGILVCVETFTRSPPPLPPPPCQVVLFLVCYHDVVADLDVHADVSVLPPLH